MLFGQQDYQGHLLKHKMCILHLKRRQVIDLRLFIVKIGRQIDGEDGSAC